MSYGLKESLISNLGLFFVHAHICRPEISNNSDSTQQKKMNLKNLCIHSLFPRVCVCVLVTLPVSLNTELGSAILTHLILIKL